MGTLAAAEAPRLRVVEAVNQEFKSIFRDQPVLGFLQHYGCVQICPGEEHVVLKQLLQLRFRPVRG